MADYVLCCCSTADLTKEQFDKRDIHYIYSHYEIDGVSYWDDFGQSMSFGEFYGKMRSGADTKTYQVNAAEFESFWEPFLQEGKDVFHIALSSGISGTYNSANIAKEILEERYPGRKVYVVDSICASSGYGLLVDKLVDLRDEGMEAEELFAWAEENKYHLQTWFFSTDLTFYIKGGRISKTAGFVGGLLNICPLMNMDREGHLVPRQKIRTKKRVIEAIEKQIETYAENGLDYSDKCYICHSDCYEDARVLADMIESRFPKLKEKVTIYDIGTTIGSHTGPGTAAVFFWGQERAD